MEAKELRIGNLVYEGKDIIEISGILKNGFYFGQHGYAANILDWFQPIPLSEEWLLKFGFEKGFKQYEFINWGIKIELFNNEWISMHGFAGKFSELTSLQYVHQLQNLYFALTGQELEIIS